jgi:transcriptional regulator of acetoin/glycerol metabolism
VTNEAGGSGPRPVDVSIPFKVAKETLIDAFERAYIKALLEACGGNMTRAARQAGIDRMYLHRIVQKHGLKGGGPPSSPGGSTPPGDG